MKETSYMTLPGCHVARLFFSKKEFLRSRVEKITISASIQLSTVI